MPKILSKLLNLILPPRCKKCGKIVSDDNSLCEECFNSINFISAPYCSKCGRPFEQTGFAENKHKMICAVCAREKHPWFRLCRSAVKYDDNSKPLIIAFKFHDCTDDAALMAKWMKNAGRDIWAAGAEVIVPVPLHYTRLIKRRYNQSSLIAKELSKLTGLPVDYSSLIRHRKTRPQVEFSGKVRIRNVKDAFSVRKPERIKGRRVVLIDDVMTTGSTLKECAKALRRARALSVDALTVARVCKY